MRDRKECIFLLGKMNGKEKFLTTACKAETKEKT